MKRPLDYPAIADVANLTGTTVVYREREGEPEFVVVCGECEEIKTLSIREAMESALRTFLKWHYEGRHNNADSKSDQAKDGER